MHFWGKCSMRHTRSSFFILHPGLPRSVPIKMEKKTKIPRSDIAGGDDCLPRSPGRTSEVVQDVKGGLDELAELNDDHVGHDISVLETKHETYVKKA